MNKTVNDRVSSRAIRAEAAVWVESLHGIERTNDIEAGLALWLASSPEHRLAFEKATAVWNEMAGISTALVLRHSPVKTQRVSRTNWFGQWNWSNGLALAASVLIIIGGAWYSGIANPWLHQNITTAVGEQRTVVLKDGTRLTLNTDSSVVIPPWHETREVKLERGEAYFEVAKNAAMPFVVLVGDKEVVAIGTSFMVRRDRVETDTHNKTALADINGGRQRADEKISVTLVEGKVAVAAVGTEPKMLLRGNATMVGTKILAAGERLTTGTNTLAPAIDRPKLDGVTSWRRGEIVFDAIPLGEAVAEMNRYSSLTLEVSDLSALNLPVSGVFRTGDSESFVKAATLLYGRAIVTTAYR